MEEKNNSALLTFFKILKYGFFLLVGFLLLSLILLANVYKNFQNVYQLGQEGKNNLNNAVYSLQSKSWSEASLKAESAVKNFNEALEQLNDTRENILIKKVGILERQVDDLEYLLKTTEIIGRTLARASSLAEEFSKLNPETAQTNLLDIPAENKLGLLRLIYESEPELNGLKANLNIALLNIDKIHRIGILWPLYGEISEYRLQLQEAINLLENIGPLSKLLLALGGYPEENNLLIILQNNDELRPSGGFIGSFGLATIKAGEISSLVTKDSYHLDMPAVGKWKLEPPAPIKKYLQVENWYLRDANWSPDWPTSARQIQTIYSGESRAIGAPEINFTSIIALNPDFIADLLRIVGPITIDEETYTPENFQTLLQYTVEVSYKDKDISSWDRKNVINDLVGELKNRLFKLSLSQWPQLIKTIENNIQRKNIQIYFTDDRLKGISENLKASGEVKKSDSDFIMVVDANLAAFKSDAVVKKEIAYDLYNKNNQASASLSLRYRHEGGFDWRTTRYRSYTRVYLPLGSRFVSVSGLDKRTADWLAEDNTEMDKTIFSFFFTVEPGTNKEIILHYSLPDEISQQIKEGKYELLVQRQSGRRTEKLEINLYPENKPAQTWQTDLEKDQTFRQLER